MSVFVHPDGYYQVTSLQDIVNVKPGSLMANAWRGMNERRQLVGRKPLRYEGTAITEVDDIGEAVIVPGAVLQNAAFWREFATIPTRTLDDPDDFSLDDEVTGFDIVRPPDDGIFDGTAILGGSISPSAFLTNFEPVLSSPPPGLFDPINTEAGDIIGASLINSVLWKLWVQRYANSNVVGRNALFGIGTAGGQQWENNCAGAVLDAYQRGLNFLSEQVSNPLPYIVSARLVKTTSSYDAGCLMGKSETLYFAPTDLAHDLHFYVAAFSTNASDFRGILPGFPRGVMREIAYSDWPGLVPGVRENPFTILGVNCPQGVGEFQIGGAWAIHEIQFSDLPP